jgi:hypothetical protein
MELNPIKFNEVANDAKAKTDDKRWLNAIDSAFTAVVFGSWVITELADAVAVTTESGQTYFANGVCQCEAFKRDQPCKHRALARLVTLYHETNPTTEEMFGFMARNGGWTV